MGPASRGPGVDVPSRSWSQGEEGGTAGVTRVPGARGAASKSSTRPSWPDLATSAGVLVGLLAVAGGTFLPWLRTGLATRNSFRAAGLINRLLAPPGLAGLLLSAWPLIVLACAVAIALLVLHVRRTASGLAALTALAAGGVAFTTLLLPSRSYATVARSGPAVTGTGACLVLVSVAISLARALRDRRRRRAGGSTFDGGR